MLDRRRRLDESRLDVAMQRSAAATDAARGGSLQLHAARTRVGGGLPRQRSGALIGGRDVMVSRP